ncbi:hypothetical protein PFISCL1PPCAC_26036 [Pristionchus fissidentatus]|uniref:Alpha-ketoglutarate-dependent dioxygenase AlkB-like domain-containing protein n=1 Tax=Pristionchus fissidentatus TaxID=1538716 RepID=A0AAV5WVM0_9BILA|nr:hypothetical protein PFISCL1PPCAC_26036 [Pristionchus fissidentatus]
MRTRPAGQLTALSVTSGQCIVLEHSTADLLHGISQCTSPPTSLYRPVPWSQVVTCLVRPLSILSGGQLISSAVIFGHFFPSVHFTDEGLHFNLSKQEAAVIS